MTVMTDADDRGRSNNVDSGIRRGTVMMQRVYANTGVHLSSSGMAVVELDPLEQVTGFLVHGTLWGNRNSHMSGFLVYETH